MNKCPILTFGLAAAQKKHLNAESLPYSFDVTKRNGQMLDPNLWFPCLELDKVTSKPPISPAGTITKNITPSQMTLTIHLR